MNTRITATRRFHFCASHRLAEHEGKCAFIHGHNYIVEFTVQRRGDPIDSLGRVLDFSVMADCLGAWIDRYWDHAFILRENDTLALHALQAFNRARETMTGSGQSEDTTPTKHFTMLWNPTAECMALYLLECIGPTVLGDSATAQVKLIEVTIWETENCRATARLLD